MVETGLGRARNSSVSPLFRCIWEFIGTANATLVEPQAKSDAWFPGSNAGLRSGKEVTSPPPRRVAGEHYCSPAPSERHVNLSVYAAQASRKVPCGTRWGTVPHLHDTGLELTSGTRRRPHQQASCCHLLCLPSQLFRRSRAETPEGSRPAFAWSDLTRGLNPYPPCYRAAFASSLLLNPPSPRPPLRRAYPEGRTTGLPRSTDVSRMV